MSAREPKSVWAAARRAFREAADAYFNTLAQTNIDVGWVASRRADLATAALRLHLLEQGRRSAR